VFDLAKTRDGTPIPKVLDMFSDGPPVVAEPPKLPGHLHQKKDSNGKPAARGKIVKTYDYRDESGSLLYQAVRMEPKDFRQRRPDGKGGWIWKLEDTRRVLYNLPEIARSDGKTVFIVEGEKDADNLRAVGLCATTNVGGAGNWREEYNGWLRWCHVVILPDNDEAGVKHGRLVAAHLREAAQSVRVVSLPGLAHKGDASDFLQLPHAPEYLKELQR
jgi:putative DNA primase/helicase